MWTREQEEELAELYQQYQEEDGNNTTLYIQLCYFNYHFIVGNNKSLINALLTVTHLCAEGCA